MRETPSTEILNVLTDVLKKQLASMNDQIASNTTQNALLWDMSESWRGMTESNTAMQRAFQESATHLESVRVRFDQMADDLNYTIQLFRSLHERLDFIAARLDALEG